MIRWLHFIIPAFLVLAAIGLRTADPPLLATARLKAFDLFQVIKPRPYAPVPVRIVDLDDASLERMGQWPWPRVTLARLVDRLHGAGAAVVAFDVMFAEPDQTSPGRVMKLWPSTPETDAIRSRVKNLPDHDQIFAEAIAKANVVTGFALTDGKGGPEPVAKAGFAHTGDDPKMFLPGYGGSVVNLAPIADAAKGNGSINFVPERDGVVRRVPLLVKYRGKLHPTLAVEALRVAQGASTYIVKSSGASGEGAFGEHTGITRTKPNPSSSRNKISAPSAQSGR